MDCDYVLVDTSPIAPVTDAYVLSDYCEKTLLIIRHDTLLYENYLAGYDSAAVVPSFSVAKSWPRITRS